MGFQQHSLDYAVSLTLLTGSVAGIGTHNLGIALPGKLNAIHKISTFTLAVAGTHSVQCADGRMIYTAQNNMNPLNYLEFIDNPWKNTVPGNDMQIIIAVAATTVYYNMWYSYVDP